MSAEEKLAREFFRQWMQAAFGNDGNWKAVGVSVERAWLALARHVLRRERAAVRRARGKGLGYVAVSSSGRSIVEPTVKDKPWRSAVIGSRCARVVAVPRKGGRK